MSDRTGRHIVDERLGEPSSYLTVRRGDRVYGRYGWLAGRVAEVRIAEAHELFDGVVVDFRGRHVFVDAPEVRAIYEGIVMLDVTVADLARAAHDRSAPRCWPGGPRQVPARPAADPLSDDDAVALMAALSRMYVADALPLADLERNTARVLSARTCGDLDAIADELLARPAA